ncbi:hypothetical protein [uncultured Jatrophihabitans sp.]|uniref:hypothetical protein n=1 Tax=uncultured Jatrophihabitans sp. TaxID=1610747 RepID=UPI0035CA626C
MTRRFPSPGPRRVALLGLVSVLVLGTVSAVATTPAAARSAAQYAVARPVCAKPANPNVARCLALHRVTVRKGTRGAVRWIRRAGVNYGPAGGYTPADLASAYGYNPAVNRSNHTVAVIDWMDNPYALADLNAFDRHYGFRSETARSFRKVNQSGRTSPLPARDRDAATETSLDVQAVRAVCRTCRILLVEAKDGTPGDLATAVNTAARLGATEISNSYGLAEPRRLPASVVQAYNHPGIPITVSTGDDGWFGWDWLNGGDEGDGAASFPSTASSVIAVGGTTPAARSGRRSRRRVRVERQRRRRRHRSSLRAGRGDRRWVQPPVRSAAVAARHTRVRRRGLPRQAARHRRRRHRRPALRVRRLRPLRHGRLGDRRRHVAVGSRRGRDVRAGRRVGRHVLPGVVAVHQPHLPTVVAVRRDAGWQRVLRR